MALEVRPMDARLQIQLDMGVDTEGRKIVRTKTFSKIKSDIPDQELFDLANTLIGLQSHTPVSIRKVAQSDYVDA